MLRVVVRDPRVRELHLSHKTGSGHKGIGYGALLAQILEKGAGFVAVAPDARPDKIVHLARQQIFAQLLLEGAHAAVTVFRHAAEDLGIKRSVLVLEHIHRFHSLPHLLRGHADARAFGLLFQQFLHDQGGKYPLTDLLLHDLLAGEAGIAALDGLHLLLVRPLKGPRGNAVAIDHGHHTAAARIRDAANAPEDEDKDDQAKNQFDAHGLGIGTYKVQHGYSEMTS